MPFKAKPPSTQGQFKSSAHTISTAAPRKAQPQGGDLVGGYPVDFGTSKRVKPNRTAGKVKRAKKY